MLRRSSERSGRIFDLLLTRLALPSSKATVLQDWTKGRRSEVDEINGLVVEVLRADSRTARVNAASVDFAHRIDSGELEPSTELLPRFAEAAQRG